MGHNTDEMISMLRAIEILHRDKVNSGPFGRRPSRKQVGYAYVMLRAFGFSDKEIDEMIDY